MSIERIDKLQAVKNDGRGVSCVRSLLSFLRHGDRASAVACFSNEYDKIRSYPDVDAGLRELLELPSMQNLNRIPEIGECYQENGNRWIVTDNTAGVITLKAGNGKREPITVYPSQLQNYKRIR